ncbi:MAG TPA: hypothetical protein EYN34_02770 [Aquifex sp.]|nr:hypothetical protein [Aquifex sp.]
MEEIKTLLIEDRFGLISSSVPRLFKPKLIVKNLAREAVEFLRKCENSGDFELPPSEPAVPEVEGFTLNVFFRLYYTDADFSQKYRIVEFRKLSSPLVDFEMKFLAGSVPFVDLSVVYLYRLQKVE